MNRITRQVVLENDFALAGWMLDHARVAVDPGNPFSAPAYLRLSYALAKSSSPKSFAELPRWSLP